MLDGSLLVVSNRQPYQFNYDGGDGGNEDGDGDGRSIAVDQPAGGLTAGLDPVFREHDGLWVAWSSGDADAAVTDRDGVVAVPPGDAAYDLRLVQLTDEEERRYYNGYSNQGLWPLCHGAVWKTNFRRADWRTYRSVNETFASVVADRATDGSVVWFQDYHFALAPRYLRRAAVDAFRLHFWHITWPCPDTFRCCPQAGELLAGLLANDLVCFHVERYCERFLDTVDRLLDGATVDHEAGRVRYDGHVTRVDWYPLGVDVAGIRAARSRDADETWRRMRRDLDVDPDAELLLGVDRLDYTKGIPERLDALERFFEDNPDRRGEVVYVQKANESRSLVPDYQNLQSTVERKIRRINDRFGTREWTPVVYVDEMLPRRVLYAMYDDADALLVTAIRDGMNLVAKEFVAAQTDDDGVLVLSEGAGAHEQLGSHALSVNPHDAAGVAAAISEALSMRPGERRAHVRGLRRLVEGYTLDDWVADLGAAVRASRERRAARTE